MKSTLKFFMLFVLITTGIESYSQIGITSYSIYALGVNTSQNKRISGELKLFTNRDFNDLLVEVNGFFNFKPRKYHRFSIGLGINIGPFRDFDYVRALTIPASIEIYPLQEFKKISILFELTPEFIVEENVHLRSLWGIRYTFGDL